MIYHLFTIHTTFTIVRKIALLRSYNATKERVELEKDSVLFFEQDITVDVDWHFFYIQDKEARQESFTLHSTCPFPSGSIRYALISQTSVSNEVVIDCALSRCPRQRLVCCQVCRW